MILVDANVLLDVLQDDPKWAAWSQGQLESAAHMYIGAHAAVSQCAILARDIGRYRSHFPTVPLITPDSEAR
jgi:predicted nucleic acid-binding protein